MYPSEEWELVHRPYRLRWRWTLVRRTSHNMLPHQRDLTAEANAYFAEILTRVEGIKVVTKFHLQNHPFRWDAGSKPWPYKLQRARWTKEWHFTFKSEADMIQFKLAAM